MLDRSKIEELCYSTLSVSSEYAKDPSKSPGEIAEKLYGSHVSGTGTISSTMLMAIST